MDGGRDGWRSRRHERRSRRIRLAGCRGTKWYCHRVETLFGRSRLRGWSGSGTRIGSCWRWRWSRSRGRSRSRTWLIGAFSRKVAGFVAQSALLPRVLVLAETAPRHFGFVCDTIQNEEEPGQIFTRLLFREHVALQRFACCRQPSCMSPPPVSDGTTGASEASIRESRSCRCESSVCTRVTRREQGTQNHANRLIAIAVCRLMSPSRPRSTKA